MWKLAISEDQFDEIYDGLDVDKSIFKRDPKDADDFVRNFLSSKLYRLNTFYKIVNKTGELIRFQMNYAQHRVYAESLRHPRLIILKSRQQGISTFWLINFFDDAITKKNLSIGLMAQGLSEAGVLLKRIETAWDNLDEDFKELLGVERVTDNNSAQSWNTGSTIYIRTSFRSATLQRLHISEYGKIANQYPDKAREVRTGTLQAIAPSNVAVIESTAEGENAFKEMWDKAEEAKASGQLTPEDFSPVFLSWLDDPDCNLNVHKEPSESEKAYLDELEKITGRKLSETQRNFWVAKHQILGEQVFQEYPAIPEEAFRRVHDGTYYARLFSQHVIRKGRIVEGLYEPTLPVYVFMDLGMDDTFVLLYAQFFNGQIRIIDEYTNSGEGLEHYVNRMKQSGYQIEHVYAPHDITVKELGSGKSRLQRLRELGVTNVSVLPRLSVEAGIERVRACIPRIWMDKHCTYLKGCFLNYSREWDEKREVWKTRPLHDKWSHGADAIRYMCISPPVDMIMTSMKRAEGLFDNVVDGLAI